MSTFSRIFFKNIALTIIFCVCYFSFSFYSLNNFVIEEQSAHQVSLKKITEHYKDDDLKGFSRQLKLAFEYDELLISNFNDEVIYSYKNENATFNPLTLIDNEVPLSTVKNNALAIFIKYRVNNDQLYKVYYTITSFVIAVVLLVLILGSFITNSIINSSSSKAKRYISKLIAVEIKTALESTGPPNTLKLPKEFAEMNSVLVQLQSFVSNKQLKFEELQQTAFIDHLTDLENRSSFVDFFDNYIEQSKESAFGVLIITRCSELMTINQIHSYQEGDRYIRQVANILKKQVQHIDSAHVYRLNGSDFAIFLPNTTVNQAEKFCAELTGLFNEYQQFADYDSIAYSGIVKLDLQKPLGEMLALADSAISLAQTRNKNSWYVQSDPQLLKSETAGFGNQNWNKEISFVIEHQSASLLSQVIQPNSRNNRIYNEVLSRFTSSEGDILPTETFIAMAEKLDKIILIDRLVIEKTLVEIKAKNLSEQAFGINLSTRSIHDQHFVIWLERRLLKDHDIATRLIFEISEYGLEQNIRGSKHFIEMIHRVGARICVEHFGVGVTSFKFFRELSPDFIKIDGSYTRDIHIDKNNQYFLRLMIDLAHRLGVRVLAESVETQEEKCTFDEIFVDGCQGFYLAKPEPL
ncbi:EAL domain-containing protein [Thalassotalea sp. ND16A]|uniref:EAL domain-containing protein n=1 Tax=Thalassotalea sp. ND16A TaxID=1535422 RepID=UPI00051A6C00|nr:EAL domain-containing protein [Thalassotalea sp. ND16A]KGJ88777.1 putative diguanylate phosphodiesterase [Thalassotalea sp. ND16A]